MTADQTHQRVLVVDDDDAIRLMVERVLRRECYQVECAHDGYEAIQKLATNRYGTVVLDLMMPRVDGHGVLRYLDEELADARPQVIVMTANVQGAEVASGCERTFRVLPKPFELRDLIAHVRECADQAGATND